MPKPLIIVAALVLACVSAAAGWFGVKAWRASQTVAQPIVTASPTVDANASPGADTVNLTFDVEAIDSSVEGLLEIPACGETYAPEPHVANGVEARVDGAVMLEGDTETLQAHPGYRATEESAAAFLATEGTIVVTRDDVVVSPDWGAEFVPEYYVAQSSETTLTQGEISMSGGELCDVADERSALWDAVDWANDTEAEIAEVQAASDAFDEAHKTLPAGEYKLYMLSPIVRDEPAAVARMLTEEGISGLATLQYTIAYSPLGGDPQVEPYCDTLTDEEGEAVERQCNVPAEVLTAILERDVPTSYVVPGDPDVAVSEAYSITVK